MDITKDIALYKQALHFAKLLGGFRADYTQYPVQPRINMKRVEREIIRSGS